MINNITWKIFDCINGKNAHDAFEDLTRIYFKIVYLNNIHCELLAKRNIHPGFESDPILFNGKKLAFQSKYSSKTPYNLFIKSLKVARDKYKGSVDTIYLFTNCGIDSECKSYKEIISLGNEIGAEIKFVCNDTILDTIKTDDRFKNVRSLFFKNINIDDEWFANKAKLAISEQLSKYDKNGFNLVTKNMSFLIDNVFENDFHQQLLSYIKDIRNGFDDLANRKTELAFDCKIKCELLKFINTYIKENIGEKEFLTIHEKIKPIKNNVIKELNKRINDKEQEQINNDENAYLLNSLDLIEKIDSVLDQKYIFSISKIHIVEGDFGCGKTHLFKYICDRKTQENKRCLLLYGDSFVYENSTVENEIMKALGLENLVFDEFLNHIEAKGECDGQITYLLIDAINECKNYAKWKTGLNNLVEKISKYRFIKVVISLRTSYSKDCFGDSLGFFENNHLLSTHHFNGLSLYNDEIYKFLDHYEIKYKQIYPRALQIFTKPLLLNLYCKMNQKKDVGSIEIIDSTSILTGYVNSEEDRWNQKNINIIFQFNEVIKIIGEYFVTQHKKEISLSELTKLLIESGINPMNIKYMEKSDILEEKVVGGQKYYKFYYDAFVDKACADAIFNEDKEKCNNNIVKFIGNDTKFKIFNYSISLLLFKYKKTFGDDMHEIFDILSLVIDQQSFDNIFVEYLKCLLSYSDIDSKHFVDRYKIYLTKQNIFFALWHRLINKYNESNHYFLIDELLMPMSLKERDYNWTIFINDEFNEYDSSIKECLKTMFADNYNNINENDLILLVWLLTSSNRELRDYVSKELVKIFINDEKLIYQTLLKYIRVNDPYVVSRLLAATYGALSIKHCIDKTIQKDIASIVFNSIFSNDVVYEDIQVRDYARGIIEVIKHNGVSTDFDLKKCYPPYNSKKIPDLKISDVEALYPENDYKQNLRYGTSTIAFSMSPELKIGRLTQPYGDFGRYVFDSKLDHFEIKNKTDIKKKIFLYAYYYIVNNLGYDNDLFTEYDYGKYSYRSRKNQIERIGKKYEWLSMFHVLARVSDNYKVENYYDDEVNNYFAGTWNPFVRDFDPTQLLKDSERIYEDDNSCLNISEYKNFRLGDHNWVTENLRVFQVEESLELYDKLGNKWIPIDITRKHESGPIINDGPYQSIWFRMRAYFIENDKLNDIVDCFNNKESNLFDNIIYENGYYELYAYEYTYSSAYLNYVEYNDVIALQTREDIKVKSTEKYKQDNSYIMQIGDTVIKNIITDDYHFEPRYKTFAELYVLSHEYNWEAEYDCSKDDNIVYNVPSKKLIDLIGAVQMKPGLWFLNDELVIADFSLFKNSNVEGLYVKESALLNRIPKNLKLMWLVRGELLSSNNKNGDDSRRVLSNMLLFKDANSNNLIKIDRLDE